MSIKRVNKADQCLLSGDKAGATDAVIEQMMRKLRIAHDYSCCCN
jgi:hypothetical protein